ncbi:hypothetical protein LPQ06_28485, partial [Klebsiella pneumoniae]|nr:hypothetical protein [Klebsiella pneumoniae]
RERMAFAERAAMHFADHPEHWTYADGNPEAGELLALRWGLLDRAVLVLRVSDEEPVIYADLVHAALARCGGAP